MERKGLHNIVHIATIFLAVFLFYKSDCTTANLPFYSDKQYIENDLEIYISQEKLDFLNSESLQISKTGLIYWKKFHDLIMNKKSDNSLTLSDLKCLVTDLDKKCDFFLGTLKKGYSPLEAKLNHPSHDFMKGYISSYEDIQELEDVVLEVRFLLNLILDYSTENLDDGDEGLPICQILCTYKYLLEYCFQIDKNIDFITVKNLEEYEKILEQ